MQGFYPAEKFLKRCEVGYYWEIKDLLNSLHITNILNKFSIMLVPIILEENKDEKLMLVVDLLRIFTGIQIEMSWFYNKNGCLDKPDIPARWTLNCLLTFCAHIMVRRRCTLDLSVVGTICFELGFHQSRNVQIPPCWLVTWDWGEVGQWIAYHTPPVAVNSSFRSWWNYPRCYLIEDGYFLRCCECYRTLQFKKNGSDPQYPLISGTIFMRIFQENYDDNIS